eukprot:TRINITY_DN16076_c0_g1_i1.p1 TRINITY_DN16076_c0_g1~~TRINITY_DN16076_c0_g1_i1.p1  ORF type:complete len:577 (-),score=104.88 TRINITY_DN16076_c0_g1_i1:174-1904(-)
MGCSGSAQATQPEAKHKGDAVNSKVLSEIPASDDADDLAGVWPDYFHVNFRIGELLGKGAFAQVFLARDIVQGSEWAVKVVDCRDQNDLTKRSDRVTNACKNEIQVLRAMSAGCRFVIQAQHACLDEQFCYIVMERGASTLFKYLIKMGASEITERLLQRILRDVLYGLIFIHRHGVVHRDIKPDNVLMGQNREAKICDFGLAKVVSRGKSANPLKGVFGTAPFMSPEMLQGQSYNKKTDMWSLGVFGYAMLLGAFPYHAYDGTKASMKESISTGKVLPSFAPAMAKMDASATAVGFLQSLLDRSPVSRPSADKAALHAFMHASYGSDAQPGSPLLASRHALILTAKKAGAFGVDVAKSGSDYKDSNMYQLLKELQTKYQSARVDSSLPGSNPDLVSKDWVPGGLLSPSPSRTNLDEKKLSMSRLTSDDNLNSVSTRSGSVDCSPSTSRTRLSSTDSSVSPKLSRSLSKSTTAFFAPEGSCMCSTASETSFSLSPSRGPVRLHERSLPRLPSKQDSRTGSRTASKDSRRGSSKTTMVPEGSLTGSIGTNVAGSPVPPSGTQSQPHMQCVLPADKTC